MLKLYSYRHNMEQGEFELFSVSLSEIRSEVISTSFERNNLDMMCHIAHFFSSWSMWRLQRTSSVRRTVRILDENSVRQKFLVFVHVFWLCLVWQVVPVSICRTAVTILAAGAAQELHRNSNPGRFHQLPCWHRGHSAVNLLESLDYTIQLWEQ